MLIHHKDTTDNVKGLLTGASESADPAKADPDDLEINIYNFIRHIGSHNRERKINNIN